MLFVQTINYIVDATATYYVVSSLAPERCGSNFNKNDVWTPKYPRRPKDQYTAQIVNTLELSAPHQIEFKIKTLQPGNQPGEVSNIKYIYICSSKKWSHCETVALWNNLGTYKTSSIPLRCHWKPNCQRRSSLSLVAVLLIPLVCHVHLHQYSWFGRIFSAVAIDIENPHHYWNGVYR